MERATETTVNKFGLVIKKCCASCQHKYVENDGARVCAQMMLKVQPRFKCKQWQMSEGLMKAGMQNGGVVRLRETKEIVIS